MKKSIGIKAEKPNEQCNDPNCPFHGSLSCRGSILTATVVSAKMHKTVSLEIMKQKTVHKFERHILKRTTIKAHNPSCINAKEGDVVRVSQCRPLSKTKHYVVIESLGKEKGFTEKIEALEQGKFKRTKKEEKNIVNETTTKDESE